jgi:hypothetical protein
MRGFRPSYYDTRTEETDNWARIKQENLQRYIERVREGLPVFDDESKPSDTKVFPSPQM